MKIKQLHKADLNSVVNLIRTVFDEFEAPEYSDQGINEFYKFIDINAMTQRLSDNEMWVWGYYDENELVGVIAMLGDNHICLLFVKKEYHRRGIAKALFEKVKDIVRNNSEKITVNSSPYAVEVYHRLGFEALDNEKTLNGIRFTPMECCL